MYFDALQVYCEHLFSSCSSSLLLSAPTEDANNGQQCLRAESVFHISTSILLELAVCVKSTGLSEAIVSVK